jgi:predicted aspartyl protease
MPTITHQTDPKAIKQLGLLLDVQIGISFPQYQKLQQMGLPVPKAVQTVALIDTGASISCISPDLAEAANLVQRGEVPISGVGAQEQINAPMYDAAIKFTSMNVMIPAIPLVAVKLAGKKIGCLIGRDLLSQGILIYHGKPGLFTFAF